MLGSAILLSTLYEPHGQGAMDGAAVGRAIGTAEGPSVGRAEGVNVGSAVGDRVGGVVGFAVGVGSQAQDPGDEVYPSGQKIQPRDPSKDV